MDAATTFRWLDQIADDHNLPPAAARVAIVLRRYVNGRSGTAWPSQARMREATGLSRTGLQNTLRALVARGHLSVDVQRGRGSTNEYRPALIGDNANSGEHFPPENANSGEHLNPENAKPSGQGVPSVVGRGANPSGQGVPSVVGIEPSDRTLRQNPLNEPNVILPDDNTSTSGSASNVEDDAFAKFWAAYPRRVAKGAARTAFAAALKKTDCDTLIAGARRYASATVNTESRYVKHAATWLRAESWLDEPEPSGVVTIDAEGNVVQQAAPPGGTGRRRTDAEIIDSWKPEDFEPGGKYACHW